MQVTCSDFLKQEVSVFIRKMINNNNFGLFLQIYRHLPVSNFGSNFDENVSRRDLKQAVINLIDSEVGANDKLLLNAVISHCYKGLLMVPSAVGGGGQDTLA